jgi:TRAP-type C4-dicarboxylate transport system permease small subunit
MYSLLPLVPLIFSVFLPIAGAIWLLVLITRFVRAFERIAGATESLAQTTKG